MALPEGWAVEDEPASLPAGWSVEDEAAAAPAPVASGGEVSPLPGPAADVQSDAGGERAAFVEGLNDALPFARDADAALLGAVPQAVSEASTAMAGGSPSWARVLEAYRERKGAGVARGEKARQEHLLPYLAGNLPAAIGAGVATMGAAGPSAAAKGAAELAMLLGQAENFGEVQPADVAVPALVGRAIGASGTVGVGIVKAIAGALKVPIGVAEGLFARFGASRLGKMIAGSDPTPEGNVISDRVAALRSKIDAADKFKPAPGPKIDIATPADANAFSLAQDVEHGMAAVGKRGFAADPALEGNIHDDALREAMAKNVPDFDPNADLLGEFERIKYPAAAQTAKKAGAGSELPTKNALAPKASKAVADEEAHIIDHSDVYPDAVGPPRLGSRDKAWQAIKNASNIEGHDSSKADAFYEKWKRGEGPKPPPWQGGEFDEINEILGLKGARRVSGAREAFDRLMNGAKDWSDVQDKLEMLRTMPGFEGVRLPDAIQDMMMPHPSARSASFNVAELNAQLAADARAAEGGHADAEVLEAVGDGVAKFRTPGGREREVPLRDVVEGDAQKLEWRDKLDRGDRSQVKMQGSKRTEESIARRWDELGGVREPEPDEFVPGPSAVERAEQWQAVKKDTAAGVVERRAAMLAKVREYRALLREASEVESQNRAEAERLRGLAKEAAAEIENINRGRRATEKIAGAYAGWHAGSAGGVAGRVGAASAGFKLGIPVGLSAEASTVAGQKLSAWAAAHADQWATRGDKLGSVARWALGGSGGPSDLRMFMLGRAAQGQTD